MNFQEIIKFKKNEVLSAIAIIILTVLVPLEYLPFLSITVIIIFFQFLYKEKFVIIYTIITFLTVTTALGSSTRAVIQITNLLLLGYYFIKQNGLKFREYPRMPIPFILFIGTLLLLMVISSINSNLMLGLEQIFRLVIFLIITYFYYSLVNIEKDYALIIKSFYVIAVIYSAYLIYEFIQSDFNIVQYNLKTVTAVGNDYLNKNQMGGFFSILLILTFSYFFYYRDKNTRIFLSLLTLISVIGMMLLNSRISILTTIIGLVFILYHFNRKFIKWVLIIISAGTLVLLINPVYELFEIYFRLEKISSGRDYIMETVWIVIKDNWILGAGPAGTKYAMYHNLPYMLNSPVEEFIRFHYNQIEFGHAHSFYLFFLSDLGIVGLILSLLLPGLFFNYSYKTKRVIDKGSIHYYTIIGIMGGGLSMFIRGIFEWGSIISYGMINYDLPFWLMLVIIFHLYTKTNIHERKI